MVDVAIVGLGANLGDRLTTLRSATAALSQLPGVTLTGRSRIYESDALGPPQPRYLNAAVRLSIATSPRELLDAMLAIERSLGRERPDPVRWGPRTIDLDLLWLASGPFTAATLRVPHPHLRERPFALLPLLDLEPDARAPEDGQRYAELPAAQEALPVVALL